jgi:hypothetical protein
LNDFSPEDSFPLISWLRTGASPEVLGESVSPAGVIHPRKQGPGIRGQGPDAQGFWRRRIIMRNKAQGRFFGGKREKGERGKREGISLITT